jgi:gliding motility-associated-like protein
MRNVSNPILFKHLPMLVGIAVSLFLSNHTPALAQHQASQQASQGWIRNEGQWPEDVRFARPFSSGMVFLTDKGLVYSLLSTKDIKRSLKSTSRSVLSGHALFSKSVGGKSPIAVTSRKLSTRYNYLHDKDAFSAYAFAKVRLEGVYHGIDVLYESVGGKLKYSWEIAPNIDPSRIKQEYGGAQSLLVEQDGKTLTITTELGKLTETIPAAYTINRQGDTTLVDARFSLCGSTVMFTFPNGYDKNQRLVIDPLVGFASYDGGTAPTQGEAATFGVDSSLYAATIAYAPGFPVTAGAYQTTFSAIQDLGLLHYSQDGSTLRYATYLGGEGREWPLSLKADGAGRLTVLAVVDSTGFPTTASAISETHNGLTDYAIATLSADGTQLVAGTYFGGSSAEGLPTRAAVDTFRTFLGALDADEAGNLFIVGSTRSQDLPLKTPYQGLLYPQSLQDGLVMKIDPTLTTLGFSTYLGGENDDAMTTLAITSSGSVYVGGVTQSDILPLAGPAYQGARLGGLDGYIAHLNSTGNNLNGATYIGTPAGEVLHYLALTRERDVYALLSGDSMRNIPVPAGKFGVANSMQTIYKLNPQLTTLEYRTPIGSGDASPDFKPSAFSVDGCANIYIGAMAYPQHVLPTSADAFRAASSNSSDMYMLALAGDASSLAFGSFYGATNGDEFLASGHARFNEEGSWFQAATAEVGSAFPTTAGVVSGSNNANADNSVAFRVDFQLATYARADFTIDDTANRCAPADIKFFNRSIRTGSTFAWDFGDGQSSTALEPTHAYATPGSYNVTLVATRPGSCNGTDTAKLIVQVYALPVVNLGNDTCYCYDDPDNEPLELQSGIANGTYEWLPGGETGESITPDSSNTYIVKLKDVNDCPGGDTINLTVQYCLTDSFNVLTPNGDGSNDTWGIKGKGLDEYRLTVVNRYGIVVFETENPNIRWNGKKNNDGAVVSTGTYFYVARGTRCGGTKIRGKKGAIFVFTGDK